MDGVVSKERKERWSLRHMTALVTGGTKGIGSVSLECSLSLSLSLSISSACICSFFYS
ncbi:hypothetical protein AMTRI_Chr08g203320 [Amborella trichopoda]